jgi:hypothetical protein
MRRYWHYHLRFSGTIVIIKNFLDRLSNNRSKKSLIIKKLKFIYQDIFCLIYCLTIDRKTFLNNPNSKSKCFHYPLIHKFKKLSNEILNNFIFP